VANIGRKFEWWFKHCNESNLNAAGGSIGCPFWLSMQVPTESQFLRMPRPIIDRRHWQDDNQMRRSAIQMLGWVKKNVRALSKFLPPCRLS
jgi:hypothetical protein